MCNAPRTFQRCMMAIFSDFLERSVEIFMDDFSVFGDSFRERVNNLEEVLEKCEETRLVLNWKKCHFMVREGIVLGYKIFEAGLDVVNKLPPLTVVKPLSSFLGHAGFYRRFIKGFSQIAKPLSNL
ncbi:Retrovirus-related Pol polyprotein from transposon 17.6 [Cucumis melo var. makuwa]|uniref:Retrovirus-related Pol polyprotein from transposon 17.6 n=1 Tax=Cucumis melo var. makuwa TaxID=1194695 RepID=A0A5D3C2W5_CUCMM|nr:Retrovirus-related Pol polyprotein from transposon 17.6 [Cucumis melo var. makuwa]